MVGSVDQQFGNLNVDSGVGVQGIVEQLHIYQIAQEIGFPIADDAIRDSYADGRNARCHPDTRKELLRQIEEWVDDPHSEPIFWLNGKAGTGKTTISRKVAERFDPDCVRFFFKRDGGDRANAKLFSTTIAAQLVDWERDLEPHVRNALKDKSWRYRKGPAEQFEAFVLGPLCKLTSDPDKLRTIVMVVDALDECGETDSVKRLIHTLSRTENLSSVRVRIFITSRPKPSFLGAFRDIEGKYRKVPLEDASGIGHDLTKFFDTEFTRIREECNDRYPEDLQLEPKWPGEYIIQTLVHRAVPLFIYAATVCSFIAQDPPFNPAEQLEKVLNHQTRANDSEFKYLDEIYLQILKEAVGTLGQEGRVKEFREVVGPIILLAKPLSRLSLSELLGSTERTLFSWFQYLHSVLNVPFGREEPISVFHDSFRDFLIDPVRASEFCIDERKVHQNLARHCIQRLEPCLRKDICNLKKPGEARNEGNAKDLDINLQYACRYWAFHRERSKERIGDTDEIHSFLRRHFLHWLEALSLIGSISECVGLIDGLRRMVDSAKGSEISKFLFDAERFVLHHLPIIDTAPLQLYTSALIFSPEKSLIRQRFKEYIPNWIKLAPIMECDWSPHLHTLRPFNPWNHDYVRSVTFSPDSTLVVSAGDNGRVDIWRAVPGTLQQTLTSPGGQIYSVAFSPDSKLIASASDDGAVRIWDAVAGTLQRTLTSDSGRIYSVAFSPDSKLVASTTSYGEVEIWDVTTSTLQQRLAGHRSQRNSVAFSPDSKLVASATSYGEVEIWDVTTSTLKRTLTSHSYKVNSVAFSPDSKLIASATSYGGVEIWDTAAGALQRTLTGHGGEVNSVAFSPDSKLIASASNDYSIKLWDTAACTLQRTLTGHEDKVNSVAFSPDSKLIASASNDYSIKIWDTAACTLQPRTGRRRGVHSVAFSPDSKLIVSASHGNTVEIWDAAAGTLQRTLTGHGGKVNSVVFSADSKLIAMASSRGWVKICDAATGTRQQTLASGRGQIHSVAFSPDSKLVASKLFLKRARSGISHEPSYDYTVEIWDTGAGTLQQTLMGNSSYGSVAFSPNSNLVASASCGGMVEIWDAAVGTVQSLTCSSSHIYLVAFSPDSKLVALALHDNTVKIWDAAAGTLQRTLTGHDGKVNSVVFSADSKLIAMASSRGWVKICDAAAGTQQTLDIGKSIEIISFGSTNNYLHTDIGVINLDTETAPGYQGYGISSDKAWITRNSKKLLWLPKENRPSCSAVAASTMVIGGETGRIAIISFED